MPEENTCPDRLPWCIHHLGGSVQLHRSEYASLPLRKHRAEYGDAAAYAVQLAGYQDSPVTVSVMVGGPFWPDGTRSGSAFLDIQNPKFADDIARLLEWLAMATPAQHRALAAQVRAAAVVAFGEAGAGDD